MTSAKITQDENRKAMVSEFARYQESLRRVRVGVITVLNTFKQSQINKLMVAGAVYKIVLKKTASRVS